MNIRDFEYLVTVAELKSFSKAAQQCFTSQPTLSSQIKKLEESLGIKVFERTNKKVMLTDTGEQIIIAAHQLLRQVDNIKEIAEQAQDPLSGQFKLGGFPTLASYLFPPLVTKIKQHLTKLKLILVEEKTAQLMERLNQGSLDAAFIALPIEDARLDYQPLFDDPFYLAVPKEHPLALQSKVKQHDLKNHNLLLLEEGHCLRDQALDVCSQIGLNEREDFRATSLETLRQMVKAGTGITFIPNIAIQRSDKEIHYIAFSEPMPKRTIALVWRKTTAKKAIIDTVIRLMNG